MRVWVLWSALRTRPAARRLASARLAIGSFIEANGHQLELLLNAMLMVLDARYPKFFLIEIFP